MSLSNPSIETVEATEVAVVETHSTEVATHSDSDAGFQAPQSFSQALGYFKGLGFEVEADMTEPCTVVNGKIKVNKDLKEDVGDYVDLHLLNAEPYWKVNLGKSNVTDAEKKLQLTSRDGKTVTLEDGTTEDVSTYMDSLKDAYPKVKLDERCALHGFYLGCEKPEKNTLVAVGEGDMATMLTVYLSPSSFKKYKTFVSKTALWGIKGNTKVRLGTEDVSWKDLSWTVFTFSALK